MRRWDARAIWFVSPTVTLFLSIACAPPPPPPPGDIYQVLATVVMHPEVDCVELRKWYGLDYLELVDTPAGIGQRYEEHFIPSVGGNKLRYWYLPSELDRGVIVLAHGAAGALPCYLYTARLLLDNGWSVAMFEFQGFGQSEGSPSFATLIPDLEAAIEKTRRLTSRQRVTLIGLSMGTIPAVALAANRPDAVNAIILDSPVALAAEFERAASWLKDTSPYLNELDPDLISENVVGRVHLPLLMFENGRDVITPPQTVEELWVRANDPKTRCTFPELPHARGAYYGTQLYTYCFETFLDGVWRNEIIAYPRLSPGYFDNSDSTPQN
ncbi:MAG: alpha/beta fold hydrolase [Phycisphaerae bacterium]